VRWRLDILNRRKIWRRRWDWFRIREVLILLMLLVWTSVEMTAYSGILCIFISSGMVYCRRGNNRATSHHHKNKWSSDQTCYMKNSHHSKAVFEQKEINHSSKVSSPQQKERRNKGYRHNKEQSMQRIEGVERDKREPRSKRRPLSNPDHNLDTQPPCLSNTTSQTRLASSTHNSIFTNFGTPSSS
jgi:hypothetical protein